MLARDAGSQQRRGEIARAGGDRRAGEEPRFRGGLGRDRADDLGRVMNRRQQLQIDAELPSEKRAPGVGPRVE